MFSDDIKISDLRDILTCDAEMGHLYWKGRYNNKRAFTTDNGSGYLRSEIGGKSYTAHRVIWAMHYGEWPKGQIDHISHNRSDNRIANLRVVTSDGNAHNRAMNSNNTSGYLGVYWHKATGKWSADILITTTNDTVDDAAQAILDEICNNPLDYIPVKQLEWHGVRPDSYDGHPICETVFSSNHKTYTTHNRQGTWFGVSVKGEHPTLESAKAAAQADFEARVKEMLG
jgi:hypothetical protein